MNDTAVAIWGLTVAVSIGLIFVSGAGFSMAQSIDRLKYLNVEMHEGSRK